MGKKKFLLCATDAGGLKNLLPLLRVIEEKGSCVLVTSRTLLTSITNSNIPIIEPNVLNLEEAERLLGAIEPEIVICGTTRYISPERYLTVAARNLGIRSVAVLDEWFNYRMRFEDEAGELTYLPDAIAVMDELARKEAIKEGLPAERCYITGSPSIATLVSQAEELIINPPDIPDFLESNQGDPIITFISETHAADYGSRPGDSGLLGAFLGYTEDKVRDELLSVLGHISRPCTFVEKLHPSAGEKNTGIIDTGVIRQIRVRKADLTSLLWHSQVVIGMRSAALLEAGLLGCPAASYQPGLIGEEQCTAVRLGLIPRLDTPAELNRWCRKHLTNNNIKPSRKIKRLPFARKNAPEKVVDLALAIAKQRTIVA